MGTCEMNIIEKIEKYLNIKLFPYQKQLLEWIWNDGGKIYLTNSHLINRYTSLYDIYGAYLREEIKKEKNNIVVVNKTKVKN